MAGPHGLMIFFRVEQGQTTTLKADPKSCALYLVGNPLIAEQIISIDVRGSFMFRFASAFTIRATVAAASLTIGRRRSWPRLNGRSWRASASFWTARSKPWSLLSGNAKQAATDGAPNRATSAPLTA